jgi:UvrB/uvrC motif.
MARITVSINECKEDLENAIKSNDFRQAAVLKDQIAEQEQRKEDIMNEMNLNKINEPQRVEKVCCHDIICHSLLAQTEYN